MQQMPSGGMTGCATCNIDEKVKVVTVAKFRDRRG